jgi:hypothetical protein
VVVREALLGVPVAVPHPQRYYHRRQREWGRRAKLELTLTIVVVLAVIAAILIFLLVYHDFPLRLGEPT